MFKYYLVLLKLCYKLKLKLFLKLGNWSNLLPKINYINKEYFSSLERIDIFMYIIQIKYIKVDNFYFFFLML